MNLPAHHRHSVRRSAMKASVRSALAAGAIVGGLLAAPSSAHAGTRAHSTCSESFARWHTDVPQVEGGYVTIDFGGDGADYTTSMWNSDGVVGLGARFAGSTIIVRWFDASGSLLDERGRGVAVAVESCEEPTTTTAVPESDIPTTTAAAEPPSTAPAPTTSQVATAPAPTAPAPTVPTTAPAAPAPPAAEPLEQAVGLPPVPVVNLVSPAAPVDALPAAGANEIGAAIAGAASLVVGLWLRTVSRRPALGR